MRNLAHYSWCLSRLAILVAALLSSAQADDEKEARAIIAKAIKATGGREALTKYPAQTWKETGNFHGRGQADSYSGTMSTHAPKQSKIDIDNIYTAAIDGDMGWFTIQGNTRDLPKERLDENKENQYGDWVASLVPLDEKEFKLALLEESVVDAKPALGVRVSRKDHRDVRLFFDKESGLLVKIEKRVKSMDQEGQELTQGTVFQNYEEVQGIKVPTKVVTKRDGKDFLEGTRSEIKRLEKLDDSLFAKP